MHLAQGRTERQSLARHDVGLQGSAQESARPVARIRSSHIRIKETTGPDP